MSKAVTVSVLGLAAAAVGFGIAHYGKSSVEPTGAVHAAVLPATLIAHAENIAPDGIDEALEDRSAKFYYCMNSEAAEVAKLAYDIYSNPADTNRLIQKSQCSSYDDPTSWSGPMLSMNNLYGTMHNKNGIIYLAGSFNLGNPAGSGASGNGIVVWNQPRNTSSNNVPNLTHYISFDDPTACRIGADLKALLMFHSHGEGQDDGPLKGLKSIDEQIEDFDFKTLNYSKSFTWSGLEATSFTMNFNGYGYLEIALKFKNSVAAARPVLQNLGFKVFNDGRDYEMEDDAFSTGTTLKSDGAGSTLTCYASI